MAPATCGGPEIDGLWTRFMAGFQQLADQRGLDLAYGRGLPGDLPAAGLQQVRSDAKVQFNPGGCPLSRVLALSILRMSDPLAGTGAVTAAELDRLVVLLADPSFVWMSQLMVVAWGRREG
ncbi:MAG: hypothetical protein EXR52_01640 [Dehalococcoidia bacterium]|nr:hypothetical protein [Dehalococcoidia bacterium]